MEKAGQFLKKRKKTIALVLLVGIAAVFMLTRRSNAANRMTENKVSAQSITNYVSFVGNVQPSSERDVLSKTGAEVLEVHVERGDSVREGDIIAVLDTGDAEYNIALKEATINATETSNAYSIREAQRTYDNYQQALDAGLNSSLQSAANQLENANATLQSARDALANAESNINNGTNQQTASAKSAMDQAQSALVSAQTAYNSASNEVAAKEAEVNRLRNEVAAAQQTTPADPSTGGDPGGGTGSGDGGSGDDGQQGAGDTGNGSSGSAAADISGLEAQLAQAEAELAQARTAQGTAKTSLDSAQTSYNSAVTQFNNTKDSTIESLRNEVTAAERSYNQAAANYNAVQLQTEQQLGTYAENVQRSLATSNTTASRLELENLKEGLEDYVIVAPCDGTVKDLDIRVGDMVSNGMTAAVISDFDVMEIAIKIDEYSILHVTEGDAVSVFIDASGKEYTGEMIWIADSATIENGVSYFEATVRFQRDDAVRGGMSAEVRLVTTDKKDVPAVPVSAVYYRDNNTAYVLMPDENGMPKECDVTVGASDGIYIEITDGLALDDTILTQPEGGQFAFPEQGGGFGGGNE